MAVLLLTWWAGHPAPGWSALLLLPLIADGTIQMCTAYESNNLRRLWTGALFGYGLMNLFFLSAAAVFHWGHRVGLTLWGA